ncbi:DUF167 domain-containing protein [Thiomonas sp. FB-Cd]|uniref:DUF167 domain-containing protein n=1 Tax=Thiomonas sp. FB-Cd TaxID=1158292 RepID=UPI0004DF4359|nr:DUF167 domain-containing protein [Thiomonas sp. FB-Cd]
MHSDYPSWLRVDKFGVTLMVAAQPGAKTTALVRLHDGALRVRIAAPALDGRGNAALCAWLAHALHLTRRDVSIKRGEKSRRKQVALQLSAQEVLARLGPLLERACTHREPE